jgi:uncharacterized protein YfaS (alpha-2-macroglobulin family)
VNAPLDLASQRHGSPSGGASVNRSLLRAAVFVFAAFTSWGAVAQAQPEDYVPGDQGQAPASPRILPDQFLRGFDPVTVYFGDDAGKARGPADDGGKILSIQPSWPGAFFWADKRTLQFRPAEPWPPLARFAVEAKGSRRVLTTMMSAPSRMSPAPDSENLRPFRSFTLSFPQPLPIAALKQMLKLELRDPPGLADSPRRALKDFSIAPLPRASARDEAGYAIALDEEVPEGKQLRVEVALALGDADRTLWTGRLSTQAPFHLQAVSCGGHSLALAGVKDVPRDQALACGNAGETPQLVFSAPVKDLDLTSLKKLVRLEPAVPDLRFDAYGARISLKGKFLPDTLYKLRLASAPLHDEAGRPLKAPGEVEAYFYLGWKTSYLRWSQSTAVLEANGPRMLPLVGYGEPRADVRIHRIDPLHNGLWPFPESPVVVREQEAPPFPGEEPETPKAPERRVFPEQLARHIRLLGSPLVSKVVDLPLARHSGSARFGLDLAPLLDPAVGKKPGTYLVGLRRLTGAPERAYVRVQITNLALTAVEEHQRAVFYVRSVDRAEPVKGARIALDVVRRQDRREVPGTLALTTDGDGRAVLAPQSDLVRVQRVVVQSGDDALVLNPSEAPPQFAANHWSMGSGWLRWLGDKIPPPPNDLLTAFVFTERAIYRPGEKVFVKGFARLKQGGELQLWKGAAAKDLGLRVEGPGDKSWELPVAATPLAGLAAEFQDPDAPTGKYQVVVYERGSGRVLGTRPFKIEAYRVPTFEVQLSSAPVVRLDGPFKMKALARYFAGGNLAGQPIEWTVTQRPFHDVPRGREGYLFADSTQFARPGAQKARDAIVKKAELDAGGAHSLEVNPALDVDGSPRIYRFEATVTGPDDQQVTSAQEVRALPPFLLGMKLARYAQKANEIKPEIIAVGVDDKLLKGQDVQVRLYKRVWHSMLRESPFATGQAKYQTEQEDVKLLEKAITTDDKPVIPALPIAESGVFVVELFARDKLGRVQTLSADLYVGGATPVAWPKSREGVFELSTDKRVYQAGDTAKLILQSPYQRGQALVIVEEPGGNRYTWHEVSGGKAVHEIKIGPEHVPNLPVHAVLMRGRLGEGAADDDRYRPQTVAASLDLEVAPVSNQARIALEHPETARPGTKVDFALALSDEKGRPLSGEVTFWLVDEAVLSLAREEPLDPLAKLVTRNKAVSSVRDTRNQVVGKLVEQDEEPGGDGAAEEDSKAGGKRLVRKNFKTVPFYQATVAVGPSGKVVVPVTLSDDLTNFKVRAVAASGASRFGFKQSTIRVRLPLLVQPQLPRFVRVGDRFWAGGVVRLLEGAEGPATVDLSIGGAADTKGAKQPAELKLNGAQSVLFPVSALPVALERTSELVVRLGVSRRADGAGDAFEVKLPLLPDRLPERFSYFARLKPGPVELRPFPEAPRPGTATQQILLTSEPGVLELAAALSYLDRYPHGCLEQKMSQLTPALAYSEMMRKLGLGDRSKASGALAKRLVDEMPVYQDPQGFFGYWPGSPGDVQLTAQAVEFLAAAKKAGVAFDEKLFSRGTDALKRVLRSDFPGLLDGYRYNQQTAAARALQRAGMLDEHYLLDLFHQRDRLDIASIAELAMAMGAQPSLFKPNLATLETDLWGSVVTKLYQGKPVYETLRARRDRWWGGQLCSSRASLAQVFESLVQLTPEDSRLPLLRDGLIAQASAATGWGSTYENRRAVAALSAYLEKAATSAPRSALAIAGKEALAVDGKAKVASRAFASDAPLKGELTGAEVGARVAYSYLPAAPGDRAEALKQGLLVARSSTWYREGEAPRHVEDKRGEALTLRVGDVLEIHARITTDSERQQVAFVVPFAAGLEPLNPELETAGAMAKPAEADSLHPTFVQRLDHEVRYYFSKLPAGTHAFHFRARAVSQGSFVHPAPWAELMYQEEVRGRGEGMRVVVTGAQQKE